MTLYLPILIVFYQFFFLSADVNLPVKNSNGNHLEQANLSDTLAKKSQIAQQSSPDSPSKPFGNYESMYPVGVFSANDDTLALPDSLKCRIPAEVFRTFSKERQDFFLANPKLYLITD